MKAAYTHTHTHTHTQTHTHTLTSARPTLPGFRMQCTPQVLVTYLAKQCLHDSSALCLQMLTKAFQQLEEHLQALRLHFGFTTRHAFHELGSDSRNDQWAHGGRHINDQCLQANGVDVAERFLSVQKVVRQLHAHLVHLCFMGQLHEHRKAGRWFIDYGGCIVAQNKYPETTTHHFTDTAITSLLESLASRSRMAPQILGEPPPPPRQRNRSPDPR